MMENALKSKGELVTINNHKIHIYRQGNINHPKLVFMAGSATVAPVYDFKVLYEKLVHNFRIIVVEKFGYGYSDIFDADSDIDALVSLQKEALDIIGETGPYILVPHSMSGLEAIRWRQKYPDDIKAIIGLDMSTPLTYQAWTAEKVAKRIRLMKMATKFNLQKILCPLSNRCLTKDEVKQQRLLRKRNAFNICYINEANKVLENVEVVERAGNIECSALLFSSNGKAMAAHWIKCQKEFASILNAKLVCFDCGHYIHYYKSNDISKEIVEFAKKLEK